jgi:hypothetical protein
VYSSAYFKQCKQGSDNMGVLRFKKGGIEFEYVGETTEIEGLINRLTTIEGANEPTQTRLINSASNNLASSIAIHRKLVEEPVYPRARIRASAFPLFPDSDVKSYIKSKPEYRHNLLEIQEHFYGKTFKSRGDTAAMYHKTSRQLVEVRRQIEREENGVFAPESVTGNLLEYPFKRNAQTVEALEQKS